MQISCSSSSQSWKFLLRFIQLRKVGVVPLLIDLLVVLCDVGRVCALYYHSVIYTLKVNCALILLICRKSQSNFSFVYCEHKNVS